MNDHRSNELNLSSWENKAWMGIEPMTLIVMTRPLIIGLTSNLK